MDPPRLADRLLHAVTRSALEIGILADDLTGALASAGRLELQGLRTHVQWEPDEAAIPPDTQALVIDMRSRDRPGRAGTEHVRGWARYLRARGARRHELRIDSAIRGAAAGELGAMLEGLALGDPFVVAVPAFVAADRVTVEGTQLRCGGPDVELASRLFGAAPAVVVERTLLERGARAVAERLDGARADGVRRAIIDASDDRHLRLAAAAVECCSADGTALVTMSPGGWLTHYPRLPQGFVLVVIGSPTEVSRAQLAVLSRRFAPAVIHLEHLAGSVADAPDEAGMILLESITAAPKALEGEQIAQRLARAALEILTAAERNGRVCRGIVVSGGHIASHLVSALDASGISPAPARQPLCGVGALIGGAWDGTPIAMKGGQVGHDGLLAELAEHTLSRAVGAAAPCDP